MDDDGRRWKKMLETVFKKVQKVKKNKVVGDGLGTLVGVRIGQKHRSGRSYDHFFCNWRYGYESIRIDLIKLPVRV